MEKEHRRQRGQNRKKDRQHLLGRALITGQLQHATPCGSGEATQDDTDRDRTGPDKNQPRHEQEDFHAVDERGRLAGIEREDRPLMGRKDEDLEPEGQEPNEHRHKQSPRLGGVVVIWPVGVRPPFPHRLAPGRHVRIRRCRPSQRQETPGGQES